MSLRASFRKQHPDFPWLAVDDPAGLDRALSAHGWLKPGERVERCERAGEGNMNLTLRVFTSQRSFIVKQARPWVEKYDHIPAPWDRSRVEQHFYQRIASLPQVASRMPSVFGHDAESRLLVLEDLAPARDKTSLYRGDPIAAEDLATLAEFLGALHGGTRGDTDRSLVNREMRALNHAHIFQVPMDPENGIELEAFEPALSAAASELRDDPAYRRALADCGERYQRDGPCLVHGDFFPGSWLDTKRGVYVIDPEFGFYGDPELDVGCAIAHLALARQHPDRARHFLAAVREHEGETLAPNWVARYAAAEVMRRLIGVAQLPIPPSQGFRAALLFASRRTLLEGRPEALFEVSA
ncbi:MAG: phosphotransferase [Proteobacteria bacterium]|nr:phosphotransferase [Pseudomonadota bacterium]